MHLVGVVLGQGVHILVNTGTTHNVIDSSTARIIGLAERHVATIALVGRGIEMPAEEPASMSNYELTVRHSRSMPSSPQHR